MPVPIVHFEIGCRDSDKAKKFYGALFGWEFMAMGPAQMVTNIGAKPDGSGGMGIGGHLNALGHEPFKYVTVYAMVDDIEAVLQKVESLGGKRMIPKTEVPGQGWFAWFTDPDGNCLGLWTSAAMPTPC